MIYISFREFPEDVFADSSEFDDKNAASDWFNPQYHQWRKEGKKVITLTEWPASKEIEEPLYEGTFIKGYKIEEEDETILWILITEL